MNKIDQLIASIERNYDPEHDLPTLMPNQLGGPYILAVPLVGKTERDLLEIIKELVAKVDGLERREIQKYRRENQP